MLSSEHRTVTMPEKKSKKQKQYANAIEKKIFITNLKLAVKYYGKDHLRRIFKITKGRVLGNYMRY